MLSKSCIYGIQAAIFLAQQQKQQRNRQYIPVAEISQSLNIPHQFLKKIMQGLVEGGILISQRSAKGGVALVREASRISVFEIIRSIDGAEILISDCILKLPGCGDEKPCPMHHHWAVERTRLRTLFENTMLDTLADGVSKGFTRLGIE
jgi:Rrf2 family iron-sulfur cluster assembly transcriptional regulator